MDSMEESISQALDRSHTLTNMRNWDILASADREENTPHVAERRKRFEGFKGCTKDNSRRRPHNATSWDLVEERWLKAQSNVDTALWHLSVRPWLGDIPFTAFSLVDRLPPLLKGFLSLTGALAHACPRRETCFFLLHQSFASTSGKPVRSTEKQLQNKNQTIK